VNVVLSNFSALVISKDFYLKLKTWSSGPGQSYLALPVNKYLIFYSFSLLAQRKRIKRKGTRTIWSCGLRCAPQSCRDFKNSLRSDSLKSIFGIFSGAQQKPLGKTL
jgi:hypothetical protein